MPISDEVIELAPVKKTKTTLIIMIAVMGVLFALAVAFLVMYLVKPSVTEDTNHVKDVSINTSELFSDVDENGKEVLCASIGNEYTVHSTITVDDNSSTNVSWIYDKDKLEGKEDGDSITIKPRPGFHGSTAFVTACAAVNSNQRKTIEIKIVNQGAVDIQVTGYGVKGNISKVEGDSLNAPFSIEVPYYTAAQTTNNNDFRVNFTQSGKDSSKLTNIELTNEKGEKELYEDGTVKKTGDVLVTLKDSAHKDYITIKSYDAGGFTFEAKKATPADTYVEILVQANVNNASCGVITKTIKVKVEANTNKGYVDSIFFFNKPVVTDEFMKLVVPTSGNTLSVDIEKLKNEVSKRGLLAKCSNTKFYTGTPGFELVLPYSKSITYDELFSHVLLNPVNIQYSDGKIKTDWYNDLVVTSSDTSVLAVAKKDGVYKLTPQNLTGISGGVHKCSITITDKKEGGAGVKIEVPVRIVAQTTKVTLSADKEETTADKSQINVKAVTNNSYEVAVKYSLLAPLLEKPSDLAENRCINSVYSLDYNNEDISVKLMDGKDELKPGESYNADFNAVNMGKAQGNMTPYEATLTFVVTVKRKKDGDAVFKFIKERSYLYISKSENNESANKNELANKDVAAEVSVAFNITQLAEKAVIISQEQGKNIVTKSGTVVGDFERNSDTEATLYIQNEVAGETPSIVSSLEELAKFVDTEGLYFTVGASGSLYNDVITAVATPVTSEAISWTKQQGLKFSGKSISSGINAAVIKFNICNVDNKSIATFTLKLRLIDAITSITPTVSKSVNYGSGDNASITVNESDVKISKVFAGESNFKDYDDVNLYLGNEKFEYAEDNKDALAVKTKDGKIYTFSYDGTALYKFEIGHNRITALADIFAFSYQKGLNFSKVELEFLPKASDYTDSTFVNNNRMPLEFIRNADGVALFNNDEREEAQKYTPEADGSFVITRNQDLPLNIYASSVVKFGNTTVYVGRKSDSNSSIASVCKSWFTVPSEILVINSEKNDNQYYYIEGRTPDIEGTKLEKEGYSANYGSGAVGIKFVINNATRPVESIGIYSDEACSNPITDADLLFGGFANGKRYSNVIYVKVVYGTHVESHTEFENVNLTLPSYLKVTNRTATGGTNTYVLGTSNVNDNIRNIKESVFDCTIELVQNVNVEGGYTIKAVRESDPNGQISATCNATVRAGLNSITVANGDDKIAEIMVGEGKSHSVSFELKNPADIVDKSITLDLTYKAINDAGYSIEYDYTDSRFVLDYDEVVGLSIISNDKSKLVIKANGEATVNKTIIFTFTDTFNKADKNNVFTLNLTIVVTMDIYSLSYAPGNDVTVSVTGEASGEQTADIDIVYNGGGVAPTPAIVNRANVLSVWEKVDDQYKELTNANNIYVSKSVEDNKYTLHVVNNVEWKKEYYLKLSYTGITVDDCYKKITINTLTSHLEFDKNNNVTLTDGNTAAVIAVQSKNEEFIIKANVVNDGSKSIESGKSATYKLYANESCTEEASGVSIDNKGVIKFTDPTAISGTIYYLATYEGENKFTDVNAYKPLKVNITYYVAPSAVGIKNIDSNLLDADGKTLTLYYSGSGNYTLADLSGKIAVSTDFEHAIYTSHDVTLSIVSDNSALQVVDSYKLVPKAVKDNIKVVITATYKKSVDCTYTVNIISIATLGLESTQDNLDLLDKDSSLTVVPIIQSYACFTPAYSLSYNNEVFSVVDGEDNNKTVKFAEKTKANTKDNPYNLTATLTYTYNGESDSGITLVGGAFESTATYKVTVVCNYTPKFDFYVGSTKLNNEDNIHFIADNDSYKIVLSEVPDVDVTYEVTANRVVTIGDFADVDNSKEAIVTLNENASGSFTITVKATIGGTVIRYEQTYTLMHQDDVEGKLYYNDANTEFSEGSQDIGYTTTPNKFKYEITNLPNGATVDFKYSGVDSSKVETVENSYIVITADKPTTLRVSAIVDITGRKVYLPEKTVELTATAPSFTLSSTAESIMPTAAATLSIGKADGFKGDYTVAYTIDSNTYATITTNTADKIGTLTAKANVLTDQTVIVTATVTVSKGVYAGTHKIVKSIAVKGVPLPTIKWNSGADSDVTVGEEVDYSSKFALNKNVTGYAYNTVNTQITVSGLESNEYTLTTGNKLTVNGPIINGKTIQLIVTATIGDNIHSGETVSDTITVRVLPTMSTAASGITIGNAQATYDLNDVYKNVFAPYGVSANDYAVTKLELSGDDAAKFAVSGSNLTVKDNITQADIDAKIKATVTITAGEFKGATITGTKTVSVTVPEKLTINKNFTWNSGNNKYNDLTLSSLSDIMNGVSGSVQSVVATVVGDAADYVKVTVGEGANVQLSVDKAFGAYVTGSGGTKTFDMNYVVTLSDDKVYFVMATYDVPQQQITITADIGGDSLASNAISIKSGETAVINLSADKGFNVNVKMIESNNTDALTVVNVGDGVRLTAGTVAEKTNVELTLRLSVDGLSTSIKYTITVEAPSTKAAYTANNLEINLAKGSSGNSVSDEKTSAWTRQSSDYIYGDSVKIQVSTGKLSDYFSSIKLHNNSAITDFGNKNNITIEFDKNNNNRPSIQNGFNLKFKFKTNNVTRINITVTLTAYDGPQTKNILRSTTVPVTYSVRVIDKVTANLNLNADDAQLIGDFADIKSVDVAYGDKYSGLPTTEHVTRTGYRFLGWFPTRTGGDEVVNNSTEVSATDTHTLFAHWAVRTYDISYNVNGGSMDATAKTVTYGMTYGALGTPSLDGYDFIGWNDEQGNVITANTIVAPNPDNNSYIELIAQWRKKYYTVTLYANGGTIGDAQTMEIHVQYGESFSLHTMVEPTRTGYRFDGWSNPNAISSVDSDTTITAQWKQLYTVTFDLNYTDAPTATTAQYANGDKYGTLPTPTRAGYTFDGWFVAKSGGTAIASTDTISISAAKTIYAHWTPIQVVHTVTLDAGTGGTIGGAQTMEIQVNHGESFSLHTLITPTREDFRFDDWYTTSTGSTKAADSITITSDKTLYAHWIQLYTVNFNLNGATGTIASKSYADNDNFGELAAPTRDGYTFDGWYTSQEGGDKVEVTTKFNHNTHTTLYAHWTPVQVTYTVTLDAGTDGTVGGAQTMKIQVGAGDSLSVSGITPTREGYKFKGWYTTASGDDSDSEITSLSDINEDKTLYAHWAKLYTVSFNVNCTDEDAPEAPASQIYAEGDKYDKLPVLSRENCIFMGWSLKLNGNSIDVEAVTVSGDNADSNDEITLYAVWKPPISEQTTPPPEENNMY